MRVAGVTDFAVRGVAQRAVRVPAYALGAPPESKGMQGYRSIL